MAPVGVGGRVGDGRLADGETGLASLAPARGDVHGQVVRSVFETRNRAAAAAAGRRDHLVDHGAHAGMVQFRRRGGAENQGVLLGVVMNESTEVGTPDGWRKTAPPTPALARAG